MRIHLHLILFYADIATLAAPPNSRRHYPQFSNLIARPSVRATTPTARKNRGSEARVACPLRFDCDTHAGPRQFGRVMSRVSEKRTSGFIPHLRAHTCPRASQDDTSSPSPPAFPNAQAAQTAAPSLRSKIPAYTIPNMSCDLSSVTALRPHVLLRTILPICILATHAPVIHAYAGPSATAPRIIACPGADRARCVPSVTSVPLYAADLRTYCPHLRVRKPHKSPRTMTPWARSCRGCPPSFTQVHRLRLRAMHAPRAHRLSAS
ncbi:hypothetical protein C8R44DRAFT_872325 [Mycena epipterygia]|nr:hypothetical protein C8R44DRAFT_872325 [Mycena epipterygia]